MNTISKSLGMLLLCLIATESFSQLKKQSIFSKFPNAIAASEIQFNNAFSAKEGETITLSFSNNFIITGIVLSNVQKYDNLQSMTIQLPAYANAIFNLSKQTEVGRNTSFVGRILSTEAMDGYEIKKDANDSYTFQKVEEQKLRQICSQ